MKYLFLFMFYAAVYLWAVVIPDTAEAAQVTATWTDNSGPPATGDEEDTFEIERRTLPLGAFALIGTVGRDVTTFVDQNVPPGTYEYRIRAVNAGGPSAYTPSATITIVAVPVAPSNFSVTTP